MTSSSPTLIDPLAAPARPVVPHPMPATAGRAANPALRLHRVERVYGHGPEAVTALEGVDLEVAPGEFVCMVGASGCGKSTLLSLAAGLDRPSAGRVETFGRVSVMFQQDALFPWLTVHGNVELALRLAGVARRTRAARVRELLATVRLEEFAHRRPHELSGGMRQRIALARTLATDADVLLMDEPFAALDAMTRDLMHDELERVCADRDLAVVFVTHNVREAVRLGDRVVLLSSRPGRIVATFDVELARPRRIESAEVGRLASVIGDRLRAEVNLHADDPPDLPHRVPHPPGRRRPPGWRRRP
ncbi:MAG: ABC transporter ATP-binding protein [Microthrixaceae bacterium]